MTLTPQEFEERFAAGLAHEPAHVDTSADLALGRRLLRRRRIAGATVGVAALAIGAVALPVVFDAVDRPTEKSTTVASSGPASAEVTGPASSEVSDAELLESCRNNAVFKEAETAIFGAGTPTIKARAQAPDQWRLALEAADGKSWADCFLNADPKVELKSALIAWSTTGTTNVTYGGVRYTDIEGPESLASFSTTSRLGPEVAAVRFTFEFGEKTVRLNDGYYAVNYETKVADSEIPKSEFYTGLLQITYLDADGKPIAAERGDGTGVGADGERVEGLPLLGKYPSQRGKPIG
jgi:hypothetical protein